MRLGTVFVWIQVCFDVGLSSWYTALNSLLLGIVSRGIRSRLDLESISNPSHLLHLPNIITSTITSLAISNSKATPELPHLTTSFQLLPQHHNLPSSSRCALLSLPLLL